MNRSPCPAWLPRRAACWRDRWRRRCRGRAILRRGLSILRRGRAILRRAAARAPAAGTAIAIGAGVLVIAAIAIAAAVGVRYNTSGSLPRGLYLLRATPPGRMDLVLVCPPAAAARLASIRRYLAPGSCPGGVRPLGKLLVAAAGDVVELSPAGLRLGGRLVPASRPLPADAAGRPLQHAAFGRRRLAPGEVWLYAPHPRSFDSRYFGPAATGALRGTLQPLWLARPDAAASVAASTVGAVDAGASAAKARLPTPPSPSPPRSPSRRLGAVAKPPPRP